MRYKWMGMGVLSSNKKIYRRGEIIPANISPKKINQWLRKGIIDPVEGKKRLVNEINASSSEVKRSGNINDMPELTYNLELGLDEIGLPEVDMILPEEDYSILDHAQPTVIVPETKPVVKNKSAKKPGKGK